MWLKRTIIAALALAASVTGALAQATLLQGGPWTPGHLSMYVGQGGSQPIVQDAGGAGGGASGVGLSELMIAARSPTNTYPSANSGNGPFGTHACLYDGPTTNPTGYHYLCFDANAQGGGLIAYGAGGLASQLPLYVNINGVQSLLGSGGGSSSLSIGITPVNGAPNGYFLYNNNGVLGATPSAVLIPSVTTVSPSVNGGVLFDNNGLLGDSRTLPAGLIYPSIASLSAIGVSAEPSLAYSFGGVATLSTVLLNISANPSATTARAAITVAIQGSAGNSSPNTLYTMGQQMVSQISGNAGSVWTRVDVATEIALTGANPVQTIGDEVDLDITTTAQALAPGNFFKFNFFATGGVDSSSHYAQGAFCACFVGANPLWNYGYVAYDGTGPSAFRIAAFFEDSHAPVGYLSSGTNTTAAQYAGVYTNAIVLNTATISGFQILGAGFFFDALGDEHVNALLVTSFGTGVVTSSSGGLLSSTALLPGTLGGSGTNNGASTLAYGGNVAFSGAFTFAATLTAATAVTFPTSGTLATTANANVASVSNADGTLTISPTTGAVVASLNRSHATTILALWTFTNSDIALLGSSTGATTFASANAGASNFTDTFPAATGTVALGTGAFTSGDLVCFTGTIGTINDCGVSMPGPFTAGQILIASTTTAVGGVVDVAVGSILVSGGASTAPAYSKTPTLGASGTAGSIAFGNATSGTVTLATVAGALGGVTASLPANTGTIAEINLAETWSALQTYSNGLISMTNGTSNIMAFGNAGAAAPGASSLGVKLQLFTSTPGTMASTDYALGLTGGFLWLNANGGFQFYNTASLILTINSAGGIAASSHIVATSAAPTISACGTGVPTVSGSDNFGTVVAGTVATSCVINFGTTWGTAPRCTAASGSVIASLTVTASTTQLTITGTSLNTDTINWVCGSTSALEPRDLPANDNLNLAQMRRLAA